MASCEEEYQEELLPECWTERKLEVLVQNRFIDRHDPRVLQRYSMVACSSGMSFMCNSIVRNKTDELFVLLYSSFLTDRSGKQHMFFHLVNFEYLSSLSPSFSYGKDDTSSSNAHITVSKEVEAICIELGKSKWFDVELDNFKILTPQDMLDEGFFFDFDDTLLPAMSLFTCVTTFFVVHVLFAPRKSKYLSFEFLHTKEFNPDFSDDMDGVLQDVGEDDGDQPRLVSAALLSTTRDSTATKDSEVSSSVSAVSATSAPLLSEGSIESAALPVLLSAPLLPSPPPSTPSAEESNERVDGDRAAVNKDDDVSTDVASEMNLDAGAEDDDRRKENNADDGAAESPDCIMRDKTDDHEGTDVGSEMDIEEAVTSESDDDRSKKKDDADGATTESPDSEDVLNTSRDASSSFSGLAKVLRAVEITDKTPQKNSKTETNDREEEEESSDEDLVGENDAGETSGRVQRKKGRRGKTKGGKGSSNKASTSRKSLFLQAPSVLTQRQQALEKKREEERRVKDAVAAKDAASMDRRKQSSEARAAAKKKANADAAAAAAATKKKAEADAAAAANKKKAEVVAAAVMEVDGDGSSIVTDVVMPSATAVRNSGKGGRGRPPKHKNGSGGNAAAPEPQEDSSVAVKRVHEEEQSLLLDNSLPETTATSAPNLKRAKAASPQRAAVESRAQSMNLLSNEEMHKLFSAHAEKQRAQQQAEFAAMLAVAKKEAFEQGVRSQQQQNGDRHPPAAAMNVDCHGAGSHQALPMNAHPKVHDQRQERHQEQPASSVVDSYRSRESNEIGGNGQLERPMELDRQSEGPMEVGLPRGGDWIGGGGGDFGNFDFIDFGGRGGFGGGGGIGGFGGGGGGSRVAGYLGGSGGIGGRVGGGGGFGGGGGYPAGGGGDCFLPGYGGSFASGGPLLPFNIVINNGSGGIDQAKEAKFMNAYNEQQRTIRGLEERIHQLQSVLPRFNTTLLEHQLRDVRADLKRCQEQLAAARQPQLQQHK